VNSNYNNTDKKNVQNKGIHKAIFSPLYAQHTLEQQLTFAQPAPLLKTEQDVTWY